MKLVLAVVCLWLVCNATTVKKAPAAVGCFDDDGTEHAIGAKFKRGCRSCTCKANGTEDCSLPSGTKIYIPPHACHKTFNNVTCVFGMASDADPTKPCPLPAFGVLTIN